MRFLSLTCDLDGLEEYANIHALNSTRVTHASPLPNNSIMYQAPLQRFAELCNFFNSTGTLFVITRDIHSQNTLILKELLQQGFEIASHSATHNYRMTQNSAEKIYQEIFDSKQKIEQTFGVSLKGFRAPGYLINSTIFDYLSQLNFSYDSSILPSPLYYALKILVLSWYYLRQKKTAAMLGPLQQWFSKTEPYFIHTVGTTRASPLLELPITTAGNLRWPITGATLSLAPSWLLNHWIHALQKQNTIILNFHAMDFVDPKTDNIPDTIARFQPELKIPIIHRIELFKSIVSKLSINRKICCCNEIAENFSRKNF